MKRIGPMLLMLLSVIAGGGAASSDLACGAAQAQTAAIDNWPNKPIRVIIPFPGGASSDVVGRLILAKLGQRLGQQLFVENKPGASGNIGADAIAKAASDGYTIGLVTGSTQAVAPSVTSNLPYDPLKDFKPVAMIGAAPYVLVVYPSLPVKSVAELIALAKQKPGELNYGSAGIASLAHLMSAQFAVLAGIDITHVPYKSSAQSVIDMLGGRLEMQFATIAPVLPNIRAGQLRALATTGSRRVPALPDVPTVAEAGIPDYEASLWMAFVAPAGVPDRIVARLNKEINTILDEPEAKGLIEQQGFEPEPGPPDAVTERVRSEIAKWKLVVAKAGIHAD
jgi:tripartite-type tricarboxylate transporter receptor subunit TctC